jgi:hypothetical protein
MKMDKTIDLKPTPLPDWLSADPSMSLPKYPVTQAQMELQESIFESLFEMVLDKLVNGDSIRRFIETDPRGISLGQFISWVMKNPHRKRRYDEAQEYGTYVMADDIKEIAKGEDSTEDIARSSLRVSTMKWSMQTNNRKKYGDIKQVDINSTSTIDIRAKLEQRENRVREITTTIDNSTGLITEDTE